MFEALLTFQGLIPSPCLWCCWWIGSTKPPATRFRDGVSPWNVGRTFTSWRRRVSGNISLKHLCWVSILLFVLANYSRCYNQFHQNRIFKLQSKYVIRFRVKINASNWRLPLYHEPHEWTAICLAVCGTCIDVDLLICIRFYDFLFRYSIVIVL